MLRNNHSERETELVLCGIENLGRTTPDTEYVVFGEWMSSLSVRSTTPTLKLFPFDFDVPPIQTESMILQQDKLLRNLYERLIKDLGTRLNALHGESFGDKQWDFVIGYWLRHFLDAVMVRWTLVESALSQRLDVISLCEITESTSLPRPNTRNDFAQLCNSSKTWNQIVLSKIALTQLDNVDNRSHPKLQFFESKEMATDDIVNVSREFHPSRDRTWREKVTRGLKDFAKILIARIFRILPTQLLVYSPTFSLRDTVMLGRHLKLIPQIHYLQKYSPRISCTGSKIPIDRDSLFRNMVVGKEPFEELLAELIPTSIPSCYLEGWDDLKQVLISSGLPRKPKMIYLGSGIITDEVLRLYAASMSKKGTDVVISQHGGVYGFSLVQEKTEFVETRIADKWISWGWESHRLSNVIPGPALKGRKNLSLKFNREKLLIALPPIRFSPSRLNYSDPYEIVQTHLDFLNSLESRISKNAIIRPAPNHRQFSYVDSFRKSFRISASGSFWDDVQRSRLFVCTHNATTMLEALYANFPTIILLPQYRYYTQHYVRHEAFEMIEHLKEAGIYFEEASAAIKRVNEIWDSVDEWWQSKVVQNAVEVFCHRYCRPAEDQILELANAIKSNHGVYLNAQR